MTSDRLELAAVNVLVSGRVQGVFFRAATEAQAKTLGLSGYVLNRPDGRTVEVFAEGPRKNLETLVGYLRVGPPHARVEDVITEWSLYSGRFSNFSVK